MSIKIGAIVLTGALLGLLFAIQWSSAAPAQKDRGEWAVGVVYNLNDTVHYEGEIYRCIRMHVSQDKWTPPTAQTSWVLVRDNPITSIYADVETTDTDAAYQATGQKRYALGFILAQGGTCAPAWGGTIPMSENYYAHEIETLRSAGGQAAGVFGGSNGSDLASVCPDVDSLQAAYQGVLDQYPFSWIDLNIDSSQVADAAAAERRNKAIAGLEAANTALKVSYTLPVTQAGLSSAALELLSNAKANKVRLDYVNLMAMNYGSGGAEMGQAAIAAATQAHEQLAGIGIPSKIGVTPMIGQNEAAGEVFSLADAEALVTFAKTHSYVGWLSFWSLGRDKGSCAGSATVQAGCSGVEQEDYAYMKRFEEFP